MNFNSFEIRETTNNDLSEIYFVEKEAFGYEKEAELVADLLKDETAKPYLSLLAFDKEKAIGHILFTRVYIKGEEDKLFHILAPLAVIPEYQRKGVGGLLIKKGLEILKERKSELVFVLGHIEYYPKYGFIPDAKKLGYSAPFPIPTEVSDAWMVQSLSPNGLQDYNGKVKCADELNKPEHWRE